MQHGKRIYDMRKTLLEQPLRVSSLAQGLIIKRRINESASSN